ncbi:MlaD family protein [Helicobacter sp. MIT 05-5294]|uniref:MlaD family protein n=1 Tax=Helicobacter sp. MIT 05-5294 TaxID=1548150 RepID=UPI00051F9E76|nr:MlaD family protein [Helicobacter sp. MIT 05-5294]TLD85965.1 MCE family protein [Helicobacter sp. MIT 05-5294]
MEARLNYVLLGVFFVVSLVALAGFVFWIGKYDRNLKDYHEYYLYNKSLPKGIRTETPVRYLGLPVGFVKSYKLNESAENVEITLWIKKEIVLKEGSKIFVDSQGLTGGTFLSLVQGDGAPYTEGERVILSLQENWIEKIGGKAESVFDRLEISVSRLNRLLSDKNLDNIEQTLSGLANLPPRLESVLTTAQKEIAGIGESRRVIHQDITNGDYNLRAILTPLLVDLEQNSKILEQILQRAEMSMEDFSNAPSEFLFGKRTQTLGPRE